MIQSHLEALYTWYNKNKRVLPFRGELDPYKIWISESMLQQTRVATMLPAYNRFISSFPNPKKLSRAKENDILMKWQGLGYYNRARNIHKGAKVIVNVHGGKLPQNKEELLAIPGIGPYTAAAILSLAFEKRVAVLDGNVKRVLQRFLYLKKEYKNEELSHLAQTLLESSPDIAPSIHNQAMMELGALVCLPKTPRCEICPIQHLCKVYTSGGVEAAKKISLPKIKKFFFVKMKINLVLSKDKKHFLLIKDANRMFLKNQWFFPYSHSKSTTIQRNSKLESNRVKIKISYPFPSLARVIPLAPKIKHHITKYKIEAEIYLIEINANPPTLPQSKNLEWQWVRIEKAKEEMPSSLALKVLKIFMEFISYS